jgi:hypothetical protein
MATVKQYITQMRQAQNAIAMKMGVDLSRADKQTRVAILACDAMLAVVLRYLIIGKPGLSLSDAELQAALDAAVADLYDDEPNEPPPT